MPADSQGDLLLQRGEIEKDKGLLGMVVEVVTPLLDDPGADVAWSVTPERMNAGRHYLSRRRKPPRSLNPPQEQGPVSRG